MSSSLLFKPTLPWHSSPSPASKFKLDFPAKSERDLLLTVKHGAKSLRACSLPATGDDDSGYSDLCVLDRRKLLLSLSTVQFLCHLERYEVRAAESDTSMHSLIQEELRKVLSKGKAAGVLRLVFHDAGTFEVDENSGGMNGSIIYELERPENSGLKKSVKILEKAKNKIDAIQPVSWADLISVAGTEAVSLCGGPTIPILLGRLDSMEPDPEGKLPQESFNALGLKQCFQRKGFSTQELVALSGAHTLGSKGFGNPVAFDSSYYKVLLEKPWASSSKMASMVGLASDHALVEDDECLRWIKEYADNQKLFFEDFTKAYIKLVNSGAKWKSL